MDIPYSGWIKKLIETLENGTIGIFKPRQIVRVGRAQTDAEVDNILRTASAKRIAAEIMAGNIPLATGSLQLTYQGKAGVVLESENQPATIQEAIVHAQAEETVRKEVNVAKAIIHAKDSLEFDETPVSDTPVDTDWFNRWRECASEVSNEEMQTLWGRILAGEIKNPGGFSLRTMEFVRNMSQLEAKQIAQVAPYFVNSLLCSLSPTSRIPKLKELDDYYIKQGIDMRLLHDLESLNIMSSVNVMGVFYECVSQTSARFLRTIFGLNKMLIIEHDDASKKLILEGYPLTTVGKELLRLCAEETDEECLRKLGQRYLKEGFRVKLASFHRMPNGEARIINGYDLFLDESELEKTAQVV